MVSLPSMTRRRATYVMCCSGKQGLLVIPPLYDGEPCESGLSRVFHIPERRVCPPASCFGGEVEAMSR